ncbi:MAG: DUF6175 family protein [Candidatus Cryptobacteroides sp.]
MKRIAILVAAFLTCCVANAQNYLMLVNHISSDSKTATFETAGIAEKAKDVQDNALRSLFHTLFYTGVEGVNDGKPLVTNDNPSFVENFFSTRMPFFVKDITELTKPAKNASKMFQASYKVTIVYDNLIKDLERNKLYEAPKVLEYSDVEAEAGMVLPTIMVVPYKKDGETYASILESDYDRRIAVAKVQDGFEKRDITTVDIEGKINAVKRNAQFGANDADSNDKQLLMNSGSDVYVVVDLNKDINQEGTRVSLIMKAYETSSGNILASKDAKTRRFAKASTDALCSYAIQDNLQEFLDDICKNFSKQAAGGKRISLIFAIAGSSAASMNDKAGDGNYTLSNLIRQWVRKNSWQGKYHLQGIVDESIIFDYVMIPPKDKDGLMMDAAQFGFMIEEWLNDEVGVPCSSRLDGTTVYITIL